MYRTLVIATSLALGYFGAAYAQQSPDGGGDNPSTGECMGPPPHDPQCDIVRTMDVPDIAIEGEIVDGQPLPDVVVLHPIPDYDRYVFARVNNQRILVDPQTRVVVEIVN